MDKQCGLIFKTGLILILIQVAICLKINEIRVPSSYSISREEDKQSPLVLGCDYEVEENDSKGFVLKWKHNGLQIYQWIPSKNPVVFSTFKGHIDASYSESDDRLHKHSALKFINPMANYTGNYTCQVQTYHNTLSKSAHMQIIVPETDFSLGYQRETNGSTVVFCTVGEIYPLPEVSILIDDQRVSDVVVTDQTQEYTGYYNVTAQYILPDQNKDMKIDCEVTIPATDFKLQTSMSYVGAAFRMNPVALQVFMCTIVTATFAKMLTIF
ncbi:uncharacterized protein LOC128731185 [Anopheles nili]|uniref:uncharacterized protein LOC128731185 n=1 Tax=Anopheles nili TaxID=185578 RepID=UPI00237A3CCB|nr:uncharacterized protein LOC128731185 [Anopheles nili]XP_053680264.1 uncharacterized protein LOC128731185 [Anopheles nili]XP_053680265.1 uncharacterized protein LOC128731185 [Anopheles nili]